MSEMKNGSAPPEEEYKTIRLTRHLWPDEVALRNEQKKVKQLRIFAVFALVIGLLAGWAGGSILPAPALAKLRGDIRRGETMESSQKIKSAFDIMENDWYFGKDIEDLDTRLTDQALTGIVSNAEDPHTDYMSSEEVESFTQSINRNFEGIGVEYISNAGNNIITKVFKDSPAENAGVQPGDMIITVDGQSVEGADSETIKNLVRGPKGTQVVLGLMRQGTALETPITRGEINATVYGYRIDDETGYLQLYQFGNSTASQMDAYLDIFEKAGIRKLVLDLRDNGGGYLDSLQQVASRFLPADTVVIRQEYTDGSTEQSKTSAGHTKAIDEIAILVNENTASASEVLTMALMEQREGVTVIGTKTYGKGTVQITQMFTDGSAIKYTTSRWLSPNGVWVNGNGIEPDIVLDVPDVFNEAFPEMDETASFNVDSVHEIVRVSQMSLEYLGYETDRKDGYYTEATGEAVRAFQKDHRLPETGVLDTETYDALYSALVLDWNTVPEHDVQLNKALEVLHG